MTLKPLRIVAVGRLKTPFWKAAAEHYVERLAPQRVQGGALPAGGISP